MDNSTLKQAKEFFIKYNYSLERINIDDKRKKEWESFNVPMEIVREWEKEYLDIQISTICTMLDDNSKLEESHKKYRMNLDLLSSQMGYLHLAESDLKYTENIGKLFKAFAFLLQRVDDWDMKDYYSKIVEVIKVLNKDYHFLYYFNGYWDYEGYTLYEDGYFIRRRSETCARKAKGFLVDGEYIGLIPRLYYDKYYDLYYELLDIICEEIVNFGFKKPEVAESLLSFSYDINDKKTIDKVIDSIKKFKENYSGYPMLFIDDDKNIRIDDKYELERMRLIYYLKSLGDKYYDEPYYYFSEFPFFDEDWVKHIQKELEELEEKKNTPNSYYEVRKEGLEKTLAEAYNYKGYHFDMYGLFEKYGIDKKIVDKWEEEKKDYILNLRENKESFKYRKMNLIGDHTENYFEYIRNYWANKRGLLVAYLGKYIPAEKMYDLDLIRDIKYKSLYSSYIWSFQYHKNIENEFLPFLDFFKLICETYIDDMEYVKKCVNYALYTVNKPKYAYYKTIFLKILDDIFRGRKYHLKSDEIVFEDEEPSA